MIFFHEETENLDFPAIQRHGVRLARAGLVGLVTMGSNGEAVHLSSQERFLVTQCTRLALDKAGFSNVPVIVGASEPSVRCTVELCRAADEAGGENYTAVADGSPLRLILYNYPGAVAGIDMDSDFIIRISQHPNIVRAKLTCGNTGKLTRVSGALDAARPGHEGSGYMAFGGIADFTAQTLVSGGSGVIAGGANVFPKTIVRAWDLWADGKWKEAILLQQALSQGDWVLTESGIPGTKGAIQIYYGDGGIPRKSLRGLDSEGVKTIDAGIEAVMQIEAGLADKYPEK